MYEVYINGIKFKEFPHRYTAFIYLLMHGWVYTGRGMFMLDNRVKIKEVKDE
ncbi:MAG: hypothetical protein J6S67_21670 [Methanobrevibacter sp.]|nr:hypothetical protein [Methanobrevibacter sp.]